MREFLHSALTKKSLRYKRLLCAGRWLSHCLNLRMVARPHDYKLHSINSLNTAHQVKKKMHFLQKKKKTISTF